MDYMYVFMYVCTLRTTSKQSTYRHGQPATLTLQLHIRRAVVGWMLQSDAYSGRGGQAKQSQHPANPSQNKDEAFLATCCRA